MKREQTVVLFIAAMAFLFCSNSKNAQPAQPKVKYAALGDSLAVGLFTLGSGYVHQYSKWLVQNAYPQGVELTNLGTSGWKSGDILKALREDRFYRETVQSADILTLDVGGNDLLGCAFTPQDLMLALREYHANLTAIVGKIRELNPTAPFYMMDIYSPYPIGHPRRPLADTWIPLFNREIHNMAANPAFGITGVAEVFTAFQGHEEEYTWINEWGDIHPNGLGHKMICKSFVAVMKQEDINI
jgi:lysophospholipase L1-like esterase